jgi:hypothetical protein
MRVRAFAVPRDRSIDIAVGLASVVFALAIARAHGADLNWDLLNYHVYSGFAFLHGRLGSEFMAAGMMSYLNPLPLLPFEAMREAGWHSLAIGLVLATVHAVNLMLLWTICRRLFAPPGAPHGLTLALLAMALGAASPIFIAEIGTTYADIATCAPVLGGVALLLGGQTRGRVLAAGALLGAAVGLKLTNLPFALAAAVLLAVHGVSWRQRGASLLWLVLGGVAGGVLTGGYWALLLYREFHNPVFPFANSIFHSADFPAVGHVHRRFLPLSLREALAFPFYLAIPKNWIYTEVFAPDFRFALCFVGGLAALLAAGVRRSWRKAAGGRFLGYFALCWVLWLVQFANGRYFLPLALLVGPALVAILAAMLPARRAVLAAGVCLALQCTQLVVAGITGYGETGQWRAGWLEPEIPTLLKQRPYLYLGLDMQSNSFLAAYVHPDSRFMNVDGMVPLDVTGPGGERVRRQLAAFDGATRILVTSIMSTENAMKSPRYVAALDADLNRFGLRVVPGDCVTVINRGLRTGLAVEEPKGTAPSGKPETDARLISCATVRTPSDPVLQAQRAQAAALFDKIELACPRQFPTRWNGVVMRSKDHHFWSRFYVDTDLWLYAGAKQVYVQHSRFDMQALGTPEGLMRGAEQVACEKIRWHAPATPQLEGVPGG